MNTPKTDIGAREQQELLRWKAPIIANHQRSKQWYIVGGGITVAIAAYGIVTGSWSLSIVAVLTAALYVLIRDHTHADAEIQLSTSGVRIADQFLGWSEIRGFWLLSTPDYTDLHFVPNNPAKGDMHIQTGDQSIEELRILLSAIVPELTDKKESLVDMFIRLYKL